MGTFAKVVLGVIVGGLVLVVGCAALFSAGVDEAVDEAQEVSDASAITVQQYESASTGDATETELREMFGEPSSSDDIQSEGIEGIPESDFQQSCIYYNREGEIASLFQFCFDGEGVLESKSSF